MGAPAKSHIAPSVRAAFLGALGILEGEGKTLKQMLADEIKTSGLLAVMDKVSKFQERTGEMNVNHSGEIGLAGILGALAGIGQASGPEVESEPDQLRH